MTSKCQMWDWNPGLGGSQRSIYALKYISFLHLQDYDAGKGAEQGAAEAGLTSTQGHWTLAENAGIN